MPKRFGFAKAERLKSRKQIDALFADGKAVTAFPVRVVYRFVGDDAGGVQAGVSASKKNFKRAVDRARLKRLLREAYRLQKEELVAATKLANKKGILFFLYTGKELSDFESVKEAVGTCLRKLKGQLQRENPS